MKARLLPPKGNYSGNLVWRKEDFIEKLDDISISLEELRDLGYWASAFPEGDGLTFNFESDEQKKNNIEILEDFQKCFEWLTIELAKSTSSNIELADLEDEKKRLNA